MILADPCLDVAAEGFSELTHFLGLPLRNGIRPVVIGDIAFLPEHVELPDRGRIEDERQFKRLNDAVVMVAALGRRIRRRPKTAEAS